MFCFSKCNYGMHTFIFHEIMLLISQCFYLFCTQPDVHRRRDSLSFASQCSKMFCYNKAWKDQAKQKVAERKMIFKFNKNGHYSSECFANKGRVKNNNNVPGFIFFQKLQRIAQAIRLERRKFQRFLACPFYNGKSFNNMEVNNFLTTYPARQN